MKRDYDTHVEVENIIRNYHSGKMQIELRRLLLPKKGAVLIEPPLTQPDEYVNVAYVYSDGGNYEVLGSYEELRELFTGQPTVPDAAQPPASPQEEAAQLARIYRQEDRPHFHSELEGEWPLYDSAAELPGKDPEPRG